MKPVVYVNGTIRDARDASVPVFDHGFLYGEGIYETLRTYHREPFVFERHLARLRRSAALLALPVPYSDGDLLDRVRETLAVAYAGDASSGEAYVRILLTRGVGELTYEPAACPTPTLVIIVKPLALFPAETFINGIRVSLVSVRRNHPQALNPLIKSNNLLNNALAMQEALRNGAVEALMQNHDGEIVECSQSNFSVVRDGGVITPPLSAGLLPGITRALVLELSDAIGIPAKEGRITRDDLGRIDEAFITATTREITPVVAIDTMPVGSGVPGPITRRLLAEFRQRVAGWAAHGGNLEV